MAFCKCCSLDALLRNTRRRSINCHLGFTFSFQIGRREGERDSIRSRVNNRIKRNGIPCVKTQTHTQWRFILFFFHPDQKKKNEERGVRIPGKNQKTFCVCAPWIFPWRLCRQLAPPRFSYFSSSSSSFRRHCVRAPRVLSATPVAGQTAKR